MRYWLTTAAFLMVAGSSVWAQNTTAPIFVSPYQQSEKTYASDLPSVVQAQQKGEAARTYTQAGRKSTPPTYEIVTMKNPLEGTPFGRIRQEINYYDTQSGLYYNQYDYMGLLAQRGDTAQLGEVSGYLQENGVFDPNKYQAAMQAAKNGMTLSEQMAAQVGTEGSQGNQAGSSQQPGQHSVYIVKPQQSDDTPQKIHRGYDDDPDGNTPTKPANPASKQPIFMR